MLQKGQVHSDKAQEILRSSRQPNAVQQEICSSYLRYTGICGRVGSQATSVHAHVMPRALFCNHGRSSTQESCDKTTTLICRYRAAAFSGMRTCVGLYARIVTRCAAASLTRLLAATTLPTPLCERALERAVRSHALKRASSGFPTRFGGYALCLLG